MGLFFNKDLEEQMDQVQSDTNMGDWWKKHREGGHSMLDTAQPIGLAGDMQSNRLTQEWADLDEPRRQRKVRDYWTLDKLIAEADMGGIIENFQPDQRLIEMKALLAKLEELIPDEYLNQQQAGFGLAGE